MSQRKKKLHGSYGQSHKAQQTVFLAPTEDDDITSTLAAGKHWFWNANETVISFKQVKSKWQHSNSNILKIKCTNSNKQNCRKGRTYVEELLENPRRLKIHSMKLIEFLADGNDSLKVMFSPPQTNSLLRFNFCYNLSEYMIELKDFSTPKKSQNTV